ncbi:DUF3658 domain-containing protein [Rurimicrobium arvi]|uniref:DUF1835 domain-containing protein n=1 Tax=Rurimicrobium arvi TaxID=2049916 RepID=A0ABP8MI87_9BACT
MTYHFVVGDMAAKPLLEAFDPETGHHVVVLKDVLSLGPLQKAEGQSFSEMRSQYWRTILNDEKNEIAVDDMERLLDISKQMFDDETIKAVIWMAPLPADICAYYWILPYMSKHSMRFSVINIAGLPFLNEQGKLFFPKSISELSVREIQKATRLARAVSPSELEVDLYEWKQLQQSNSGIRVSGGGKKMHAHPENFYDHLLLNQCTPAFQKATKVVHNAIGKDNAIPTGDAFLIWRLRALAEAGAVQVQEGKALKDMEVRLHGQETASSNE